MMKCLVQLVFNPSAMPKTQKPEFLIPKQSLGSVQTLPKSMISAQFNAQMKFIFCICMKNGILYKQIPWSKLTRICICQEENKVKHKLKNWVFIYSKKWQILKGFTTEFHQA